MHSNFIVNDYALIWNLLFQASISESIYNTKQKIWDTYKNEYNACFNDKEAIMKDYKNFIPNNDTIYNILLENKDYEILKKNAEKYRLEIMKLWDKNKKEIEYLLKKIIRMEIPDYTFFVINEEFEIIDHPCTGSLIVGCEINKKQPLKTLIDMNMSIVKNNVKRYRQESEKFKKAILELAIENEFPTRITNMSYYQFGSPSLSQLKRWLYPYWLMYLGIQKDDFSNYMMRDKIVFDANKYAYEKELKKMNIEEFIDFCIRNQRYIVREAIEENNEEEIEIL